MFTVWERLDTRNIYYICHPWLYFTFHLSQNCSFENRQTHHKVIKWHQRDASRIGERATRRTWCLPRVPTAHAAGPLESSVRAPGNGEPALVPFLRRSLVESGSVPSFAINFVYYEVPCWESPAGMSMNDSGSRTQISPLTMDFISMWCLHSRVKRLQLQCCRV